MQLKLISWDEQYKKDMDNGIGFEIFEVNGITKDGTRHPNGIYSPFYGSTSGDDAEIIERYSCDCKNLKGKFYQGEVCKLCNTEVVKHKTDVNKTGWMILNSDYCLIQPNMFEYIQKLVGKHIHSILDYEVTLDKDGIIISDDEEKKHPYYNIGMLEFRDKFEEVITYCYNNLGNKKEAKKQYYDFLMKHKDKVFTNHIPVFSLILRDITIIKNDVISDPINKKYSLLLGNISSINKNKTKLSKKAMRVLPLLYKSQQSLNEIYDDIISYIGGKDGHIRSNLLGNRVNFSSRCVIVPLVGKYQINDIVLPYTTMMTLYKFEILNIIVKMDKCSLSEAVEKWHIGLERFDRRMYLIIQHLIKHTKGGLQVLICRNPTLNHGSILKMRIADCKTDYHDLTMSVPVNVLVVMGGDFDGDVLNITCLKDRDLSDAFEVDNPRQLMIDRNNLKFNSRMSLFKDQIIGLHAFNK